jgi:hypothetical protein
MLYHVVLFGQLKVHQDQIRGNNIHLNLMEVLKMLIEKNFLMYVEEINLIINFLSIQGGIY